MIKPLQKEIDWCKGYRESAAAAIIYFHGDDPYTIDQYGGEPFLDGITCAMDAVIERLEQAQKDLMKGGGDYDCK